VSSDPLNIINRYNFWF